MKTTKLMIALAVFTFLLLACRAQTPDNDDAEVDVTIVIEALEQVDEPTATPPPTNTPAPPPPTNTPVAVEQSAETSAEGAAAAVDTVNESVSSDEDSMSPNEVWSADPNDLPFSSAVWAYRINMMTEGVESTVHFTVTSDFENNRVAYTVGGSGVPEFENGAVPFLDMVAVENTMYLVQTTGECFSMSSADFNANEIFQGVDSFLSYRNLEYAERGDPYEVEVNGLQTRHYVIDERVLGADVENASTIVAGKGSVYIHTLEDGRDIIVKSRVEGITTENPFTEEQKETTVVYQYELDRVNERLDIQVPAACEQQQADAENKYPVPDGAVQQAAMGGLYNWVVPDTASVEQLVTFYERELPATGWTLSSKSEVGVTQMTFTKEGEIINITLSPDGQGGIAILLIEQQ